MLVNLITVHSLTAVVVVMLRKKTRHRDEDILQRTPGALKISRTFTTLTNKPSRRKEHGRCKKKTDIEKTNISGGD